jgi:hypothetical protein
MAFKGFKDLFIVSDETPNDKPKETAQSTETTTKFPSAAQSEATASAMSFPPVAQTQPTFVGTSSVSPEHLDKAMDLYQKAFEGLNLVGFDFYEYLSAVVTGGIDSPQVYNMTLQIASGMDKSVSKETLITQADFYVAEIQKIYEEYLAKGNSKKDEELSLKANENQLLTHELETMENQLEVLKGQIEDRKTKLSAIDGKYQPKLSEINSKLAANDMAKDRIIQTIQKVKQGILINIK